MKRNISVLIVEDNLDDYSLLREVLESSEEVAAVIFHEERLESALSAAKTKAIDVAVIDRRIIRCIPYVKRCGYFL